MKTQDKLYTRQVTTTLTEEQYNRWVELCKQENKSSFILLREVVQAVLGEQN